MAKEGWTTKITNQRRSCKPIPSRPALGSKGINIMEFWQFNARTQDKAEGVASGNHLLH